MAGLPYRLHIPSVATGSFRPAATERLQRDYGDAVMKTCLIKMVAALGLVSVLAVAGAAPSFAEPIYHGYPLHEWYTTDGW
jgi:hypothetical protein